MEKNFEIRFGKLIEEMISSGWLKTPKIINAFKFIKRIDFLPEDKKQLAFYNEALPIGYGQTISQPVVVAFMLELLKPKEGEKILDIGAGSGWTSSLLSYCVGEKGKVIAIERIPQLKEFAEKNSKKYNFIKKGILKIIKGDGTKGFIKEAPFDKIICGAAVQRKEDLPVAWKEQLKVGGKIVTPIYHSIFLIEKRSEKDFDFKEYPGFLFVPLIPDES